MNGNDPKNIDPAPKRRKSKDNPYEIFSVGINTNTPRFFVRFTDGTGVTRCLEIDRSLFDAFNRFELEDISLLNEWDRHTEQSEQSEASLTTKSSYFRETVEEEVFRHIQTEMLHKAITILPEVQRRRLYLYYFRNLTYQEIAELEGCSHPAVIKSVKSAIETLKKFFSE